MRNVLLAEFNRYFCGIFHIFSHLAIPQQRMEKALHCRNLTGIVMKFHSTCIANKNLCRKKPNCINEKHNIFMALTVNRVNTNNKSNDRD